MATWQLLHTVCIICHGFMHCFGNPLLISITIVAFCNITIFILMSSQFNICIWDALDELNFSFNFLYVSLNQDIDHASRYNLSVFN